MSPGRPKLEARYRKPTATAPHTATLPAVSPKTWADMYRAEGENLGYG